MTLEYRHKNAYGYTDLAVIVDTNRKTATLYHGGTEPLHPMKKTTKKYIKKLFAAYASNPEYTVKEI